MARSLRSLLTLIVGLGGLGLARPGEAAELAFAWAHSPTTSSYSAITTYSGPDPVRIDRTGTGSYRVHFGEILQGVGGNVQVTAYGGSGEHCVSAGWSGGYAYVRCFDAAGQAADTRFSILALRGEPGDDSIAYAWAHGATSASYVPSSYYSFNTGTPIQATRTGTGAYKIELGAPLTQGAIVQVTAYGTQPNHCKVATWSGDSVSVNCFRLTGSAVDTMFNLAVIRQSDAGQDIAYTYAHSATSSSYTPSWYYTFNGDESVRVSRLSTGRYSVDLGSIVSQGGGNVQVTAVGSDSNRCKVEGWSSGTVRVRCFHPWGFAVDSRFNLLFSGRSVNDASRTFEHAARFIEPDRRSIHQQPVAVAAIEVPEDENVDLDEVHLSLQLAGETLETSAGNLVVPSRLLAYDELEVRLIGPDGTTYEVSEAVHFVDADGSPTDPFPVSAIPNSGWLYGYVQGVGMIAPTVDEFGFPFVNEEGILETDRTTCYGPLGGPSYAFGNGVDMDAASACSASQRAAFKSNVAPDVEFSTQQIEKTLRDELGDRQSWGTWLVVVRDTRPLRHDRLNWKVGEYLSPVEPLVPRFRIASATLETKGDAAKAGGRRAVTREFRNELKVESSNPLLGAGELVASGVRLESASVHYSLWGSIPGVQVALRHPNGTEIQLGSPGSVDGELELRELGGTLGVSLPSSVAGQLVDGTWRLRVYYQSWFGRYDYTHLFEIDWGMEVTGPSADYLAVEAFDGPITLTSGQSRTFTFDVTGASEEARDLQVFVDSSNHYAFLNELEVYAPNGSLVARSCTTYQDPVEDRCLQTDLRGRTLRIPLPAGLEQVGPWKVRWTPRLDPELAVSSNSLGSLELAGECPEDGYAVSGDSRHQLGLALAENRVELSGLRLGLSESRLTPELFAHRVLDDAQARADGWLVHRAEGTTGYNLDRVRHERDFWQAYDVVNPIASTYRSSGSVALAEFDALLSRLDGASARDSLSEHLAITDAMFAAWMPQGVYSPLAGRLGQSFEGLGGESRLAALSRLEDPARSIRAQDRQSWHMDGRSLARTALKYGVFHPYTAWEAGWYLGEKLSEAWKDSSKPDPKPETVVVPTPVPIPVPTPVGTGTPTSSEPKTIAQPDPDHRGDKFPTVTVVFCDGSGKECLAGVRDLDGNPIGDAAEVSPDWADEVKRKGGTSPNAANDGYSSVTSVKCRGEAKDRKCDFVTEVVDERGYSAAPPIQTGSGNDRTCKPEDDSCGGFPLPPEYAGSIAALQDASRRVDALTLEWGSLAPYITCAPDQPCGTSWLAAKADFLAQSARMGRLDPYIQCSPESASCVSLDAPAMVCQDWGTDLVYPVPTH